MPPYNVIYYIPNCYLEKIMRAVRFYLQKHEVQQSKSPEKLQQSLPVNVLIQMHKTFLRLLMHFFQR